MSGRHDMATDGLSPGTDVLLTVPIHCTGCHRPLPRGEFYQRNGRPRQPCKACHRVDCAVRRSRETRERREARYRATRAWRAAHPEKVAAYRAKYRAKALARTATAVLS